MRRLRVPAVSRTPGRLRDPPWGHYDPCARCSLTSPARRRGKRGPEPKNAATERREASALSPSAPTPHQAWMVGASRCSVPSISFHQTRTGNGPRAGAQWRRRTHG